MPGGGLLRATCRNGDCRRSGVGDGLRFRRESRRPGRSGGRSRAVAEETLEGDSLRASFGSEKAGEDFGGLLPFARLPLQVLLSGGGEPVKLRFTVVVRHAPFRSDIA